jgi:hypothetical protein
MSKYPEEYEQEREDQNIRLAVATLFMAAQIAREGLDFSKPAYTADRAFKSADALLQRWNEAP